MNPFVAFEVYPLNGDLGSPHQRLSDCRWLASHRKNCAIVIRIAAHIEDEYVGTGGSLCDCGDDIRAASLTEIWDTLDQRHAMPHHPKGLQKSAG